MVFNLYGQDLPGGPSVQEPRHIRLTWFAQCLQTLAREEIPSIAFPYLIGCNIAGGVWLEYFELFKRFATSVPQTQVYIVKYMRT